MAKRSKKSEKEISLIGKIFGFLGGVCLLSFIVFVVASVCFYSSQDNSLDMLNSGKVSNLLGSIGSYTADFVLTYFGFSLLIYIFAPIIWGFDIVLFKPKINYPSRILAYFVGIFSLSIFLTFLPKYFPAFEMGGVIGKKSAEILRNFVNHMIPEKYGIITIEVVLAILIILSFNYAVGITYKYWAKWFMAFISGLMFVKNMVFVGYKKIFSKSDIVVERRETRKRDPKIEPKVSENSTTPKQERVSAPAPRKAKISSNYIIPDVKILSKPEKHKSKDDLSQKELEEVAKNLESVLQEFGVSGKIVKMRPGPVVTLYELEPAAGIKTARVIGLADDIARSMSVSSVRIAVVAGSNTIGIEMPNVRRDTVWLRELFEDKDFVDSKNTLNIVLGKDIGGKNVYADLAKMPHLLVAGTTGSGKSVGVNQMILSILYKMSPEECKMIMIDPKMLEFSMYNGIPHLLTPVITDPAKAVVGLKWAVKEMEDRYRAMAKHNVRNIIGYNTKLEELRATGEVITRKVQTGFDQDTGAPIFEEQLVDLTPLPYIIVIVDEMADLMLVAGKEVEAAIQRLAQMARAAGIHLIMSTQRPSVDVITGTIKANFPTRISFQVTSKIDSRTILGEQGAEQLLGRGDMLYMPAGQRPLRIHGSFVKDEEIEEVVEFIKAQREAEYIEGVTDGEISGNGNDNSVFDGGAFGGEGDDLYNQAVAIVRKDNRASTSYIQRRLSIGYNKAATIIERMETEGIVSPADGVGRREVLG